MATQTIEWKETDGELFMNRKGALPAETLAIFAIRKIYPQFPYMTDVQKYLVVYGIKQRLSDPGGKKELTATDKADIARKHWAMLLDGKTKETKQGAVSKTKLLDALLTATPEESIKLLEALRANAK